MVKGGENDNNSEKNSLFSLDNVPVAVTFYNGMIDPQTQKHYGFGLFDNEGENFIKGKYIDIETFCNELKYKNETQEPAPMLGCYVLLYEQNNLSKFNFSEILSSSHGWAASITNTNDVESFVFDDNKTYYYFSEEILF